MAKPATPPPECFGPEDERERLAQMFEQAPSFMALLREPDHRIVLANKALLDFLGQAEVVGRTAAEVLPDDVAQAAIEALDKVYSTGAPFRCPATRYPVGRPGEPTREHVVDLFLQPVRNLAGAVTDIFVEGADITERHRAEQRLQSSLAIKTVGIIYWDADLSLSEVNDAFLQMTGFTREEVLGKTWRELTPEEFWPASERAVEQLGAAGEAVPYEKQYFRKDGSRWWGLFAARRVSPEETVEFVLDVSERKEAEAELRRLNETLERRVLDEVSSRLRTEEALRQSQKMEAIGQLTGGVAHDFNNLLTVIRGAAEMLRRPSLPEDKRVRYVEAISETAERAAKLTSQLLAFSRRQALRPEVFSVGHRIEALREMLTALVGSRVALITETDCDICYVEADPHQFDTALVNMAVNARDAMEGVGRLTLTAEPASKVPRVRGHGAAAGSFVAVRVSDTGSGIAPEVLPQIFEPFFTTKEMGKGTGLGLSQVYGFAKQSGGEIDVQSELGAGARFTLYLPRVSATQARAAREVRAESETSGRGHVLVVEDNEQVGAFSSHLLAELGFETTWESNAEAALRRLDEHPQRYVAVFSDVVMPGMNGIELGREIHRRRPDLPVVLTSGYSQVLAQEGRHEFELLQKPYSIDDLTRVLRRAIGERAGACD